MLIDDIYIKVKAGNGGNGAVSFRRNAQTAKGGPDGGNGGNGGSIFFQASTNVFDFQDFRFKKIIHAEDGVSGKKQLLFGKNGKDLTLIVPVGSVIIDTDTNSQIEITQKNQKICIARGGKGGRGNNEFKTAVNQTPTYAENGEKGEEKQLHLVLKTIADIGLVGLPNAGKSTLLSLLTNAKPKIGDYAFTTVEPNLGILQSYTIADIPGVIQGASTGKGLGLQFLKHIEKTKILLYCIASTDENPYGTYLALRKEFEHYDKKLLEKPHMLLLTKKDLVSSEELTKKISQFPPMQLVAVSKEDNQSIKNLESILLKELKN